MRPFIPILLFTIASYCQAQSDLYFKNFTTVNGLSHNKINCILKDKRGFIWLGTDDGLNRFDGSRFTIFKNEPGNKASISGNIIKDLHEDKDGILWIATADGGLSRYDHRLPQSSQIRQYKHSARPGSIPVNIINAIEEYPDGLLWLATAGSGILRFDKKKEKFSVITHIRKKTCLDITLDNQKILWIGNEGGGITKLDPKTLAYTSDEKYNDLYSKLPHQSVTRFFQDSKLQMWIASWDKVVYKYDKITNDEITYGSLTTKNSFPKSEPLSFSEDAANTIWVGTRNNGLVLLNPQNGFCRVYQNDITKQGSIAGNTIHAIYKGSTGTMWLGTDNGLSIYDPNMQQFSQTFLSTETANPNPVYDFYDSGSDILIGAANGLHIFNKSSGKIHHRPLTYNETPLSVTKFFKDGATLYAGTNISFFKMDEKTFGIELLPNTDKDLVMKKLIDSRIVSAVSDTIDGHHVIITSPYGHYLTYYDVVEKNWTSRQDARKNIIGKFNLTDNLIEKFFKDGLGNIWVATKKNGLAEWRKSGNRDLRYYVNDPENIKSISNNYVFDIQEMDADHLWVSTYGGGINIFNKHSKTFTHLSATQNLAEGMQADAAGNLWVIANGNIHKYDPGRKMNVGYQLPDAKNTGGVKGHIFKDLQGFLYVGGDNYFVRFQPTGIKEISAPLHTYITNFKIGDSARNDLLALKPPELRHDQNFLNFEFSAPTDHISHAVKYAYKLEGVDQNWVYPNENNTANYTNLNDGVYEFKVKATLRDGDWSGGHTSFKFRIKPAFWETWWFIALCIFAVATLGYLFYKYRINEIVKRQTMRNKIARDLHDNVGSTLGSISVFSEVAKIYENQNKKQAVMDTLSKINSASFNMISEMNDIVWAIDPKNDQVEKILTRMDSFAKPLFVAKNISFNITYNQNVKELELQMEKRKNMYLIFKESVNNALKYADCKNFSVSFELHSQRLEMIIKDDGAGFDVTKAGLRNTLAGNGLQNMRTRAEEIKGQLSITSLQGKGTEIRLSFHIP